MKEYKIAKGWAAFIFLFSPLAIALFGWLLVLSFQNKIMSPNASWLLIPVSLGMLTLIIIGLIETYKGRLIIQEESITSIGTFTNIKLKFSEIKGYTVNKNYIFIEPKTKQKKRIKISNLIDGYGELISWLSQSFPDLDEQTMIEEEQDILNDETLGWTREIREDKLLKARQISKAINWMAGITAAWIFFYPTPYQYSILTAMIIPVVALLFVKFSDGLIRIDEKNGSAYPSVVYAFIYPSLGIMLRAILDFEIFDYSNVWLVTFTITISFLFLLLIKQHEISFKKKLDYLTVAFLALFLFAYSYGAVIHINCYYDNSLPQHFNAKVLDKRISLGKSTSYYLKLSTWGQQTEVDEIKVGKGLYNRIDVDDEVYIYFRNGKLEIPWFVVADK